ncbi:MAG TPA: hypothetical protein VLR50_10710 [Desulfobacterales bacterium]|nr:hypothetical protein [Desulfobacterales bacterium]
MRLEGESEEYPFFSLLLKSQNSFWKVDFKQVRKHDLRANGGQSGRRQRPDPAFREDEFNEKCNEKKCDQHKPQRPQEQVVGHERKQGAQDPFPGVTLRKKRIIGRARTLADPAVHQQQRRHSNHAQTAVEGQKTRPGLAPIPDVYAPGVYGEDKPYRQKEDAAYDVVSFGFNRVLKNCASRREPALCGYCKCSHIPEYAALSKTPHALTDGLMLVFQRC